MAIAKQVKEKRVQELHGRFAKATAAIIADYQGMNVESVNKLRKSLRQAEIDYQVAKNTIATLAAAGTAFDNIKDKFAGVNSIGLTYGDPSPLAKAYQEFAKSEERLKIRFGFLAQGAKLLTPSEVKVLSELPSRDVLLARLVWLLKAQPAGLVTTLNGVISKFVRTLGAIEQKKAKTQ